MQYTDELAKELAARHNVPAATVHTWKHRKRIPRKYLAEMPIDRNKNLSTPLAQAFKDLQKAVDTGKFYGTALAILAGINPAQFADIVRGKSRPTEAQVIALRKAVNIVRNEAKQVLQQLETQPASDSAYLAAANFLKREEIKAFVFLHRNRKVQTQLAWFAKAGSPGQSNELLKRQFNTVGRPRLSFPQDNNEFLKACFLTFLAETTIYQ